LELDQPSAVVAIEMFTANDEPGRDPVRFRVEGSNENTNDQSKWTPLYKSVFNEPVPVNRFSPFTVEFKAPKGCSGGSECESKECKDGLCTPPDPKVSCGGKDGWSDGSNGKCYQFLKNDPARVTFDFAREKCKEAGGDLDTFDSERDAIVHYDQCRHGKAKYGYTHYRTCWLGYTDREQEGKIRDVIRNEPRKYVPKYMDRSNWNKADRDCPTLSRGKVG